MTTKLQKASIAIRQNKGRDHSPKWDNTETLSADAFTRHFHNAMAWYRLESSVKELKPKVIDWMGRNGYDRATISAFKKTKDNRCSSTVGANVQILTTVVTLKNGLKSKLLTLLIKVRTILTKTILSKKKNRLFQ